MNKKIAYSLWSIVLAVLVSGFFSLCTICFTPSFPQETVDEVSQEQPISLDLEEIRARGKLIALTRYNANSFFLYRGEPMGYEYELLNLFAQSLGVELEIRIPATRDSLFLLLNSGEGDVIAANLTVTLEYADKVAFSTHHNTTRQMLVQRKPKNWRYQKRHVTEKQLIRDPLALLGKTVSIQKESHYHHRLDNLSMEIGGDITIDTMPDSYETEELIRMVANGDIEYTIADDNVSLMNAIFYPDLDMLTPVSFSQRVAWAFRKTSPELLAEANRWMEELRAEQSPTYYVIYNKYYKNRTRFKQRVQSPFYALETGAISPYDSLFKHFAIEPLFSWTLLAAQAYQESRFDPEATSWAGAEGLMQLLPSTAKEMGVENSFDPEQSVAAGARYLRFIHKNFWRDLPHEEAVKFVLGSYNAGVGHIKDAQRLAQELGYDPNVWDQNVAQALLKLSDKNYFYHPVVRHGFCRGDEPYSYVEQILARQRIYQGILERAEAQQERDRQRALQIENDHSDSTTDMR